MRGAARWIVGLMALASAGIASEAGACGMRLFQPAEDPLVAVQDAEMLVARGDLRGASRALDRNLASYSARTLAASPAADRVLRVLAQIVVRTPPAGDADAVARSERSAKLAWATRVLYRLASANPEQPPPGIVADLAEALAQRAGMESVALYLLDDLARRDLLVSAEGYAALARLRAGRGDQAGAVAAAGRCRAMASYVSACRGLEAGRAAGTAGAGA